MATDRDKLDQTWDRADFAGRGAWQEMDDFLARIEAAGPPQNEQEKEKRNVEFLSIQQRYHARSLEILNRAKAGDVAPHLTALKGGK